MDVQLHTHCLERMAERGASQEEIIETVSTGERFQAKYDRTGFRRNFSFESTWRKKYYKTKQVEAYCVPKEDGWLVISVVTRYF